MRYLIIGIMLFLVWSAGSMWWYVCKIKGVCPQETTISNLQTADLPTYFEVIDQGSEIWKSEKLLLHRTGEAAPVLPEDFPVLASILEEYIDMHPGTHLTIKGIADQHESNDPLALAGQRAYRLRERLAHYAPILAAADTAAIIDSLHFSREGLTAEAFSFAWDVPEYAMWEDTTSEISLPPPPPDTSTQMETNHLEPANTLPPPPPGAPANRRILFSFAKPNIDDPSDFDAYLTELVAWIKAHPGRKVRVSGHTDDTASREANLRLAKTRADVIADLLRKKGLADTQMKVEAIGEKEPVSSNENREGRALNRRVDLEIL